MTIVTRTVLLVDDCLEDRETYRRYLLEDKEHRYKILEAATGEQAWELCRQQFPDAIIMDYLLPDMDGLELLKELKTKLGQTNLPVIILTGRGNEEVAVQAMKSGAADYLVKKHTTPVSLRLAIENVLSDRQRAEEASCDNDELKQMSAALSNAVVGISQIDQEGRYIMVNQAYASAVGCQPEEMIGMRWERTVHPQDMEMMSAAYQEMLNQGKVEIEARGIRKDGSIFYKQLTMIAAHNQQQQLLGHYCFMKDISDRKLAQEALRRSEEQRRLVLDLTNTGFWDWNIVTGETIWNDNTYHLLALIPNSVEASYQTWRDRVHPEDIKRVERELNSALDHQTDFENEYRVIYPDGSHHWLMAKSRGIYDESGQPVRMIGMVFDISDRKRREANAAFLAKIAEDFSRLSTADEIMQAVGAKIGAFMNLPYCHFISIDEARDEVVYLERWNAENVPRLPDVICLSEHVSAEFYQLVQAGETVVSNDRLSRALANIQANSAIGTRSFITVPFHKDGQWKYLFCVHDLVPRNWREDEIELVRELANQMFPRLERARAEAALRVSEEKYRSLFNSMDEGYVLIDVIFAENDTPVDLLYLDANPAAVRMTGTELVGRRTRELDPNFEAQWFETCGRVAKTGIGERHEFYTAPLQSWYNFYVFKVGEPSSSQVALIYQDVTERKQAELTLWETQQQLQAILNNSPAVIYLLDSQNRYLLVNRSYAELLSTTPESLIGKSIYEVWPGEIADIFATNNQRVLQGNQAIEVEETAPHADGMHTYISIKFPLHDANGIPNAVCGISTDITERKQDQEKIREQAALLDVATDAILVRDLEYRILYWNCGAEHLYGWQAAEVLGRNSSEFLYKQITPSVQEALKTVLEQGEWLGELHKIAKSGKEIIVQSRWTLMRDRAGQPKSILAVDTDITEKKQLEQQFYRTQRLESLGVLASGIAHDLNNILTPMLAVAQLLPLKLPDLDQQNQRLLKILEGNSKRGAELVKQITAFARGAEGKRVPIQPKHLLKEIEQVIKSTFPKSIEICIDIATPNLWTVLADPTQIHQVLMNLCVNARDAMADGGTLTISAENFHIDENYARMNLAAKVGDYVAIAVLDTGCGMPQELLERIFEPFFTTKEVGKGTGLGLSTVAGILKNHNAFVNVYSEVGRGSKFQIYLSAINTSATPEADDSPITRGNGELILIVDDEAFIRDLVKTSLEEFNYRVMTASSGIEAFSIYPKHNNEISLVLMDIQMPSIDGFKAIRVLQEINPAVKIIVISGLTSNRKLLEANKIKVQGFLSKPYTIQELLNNIQTALNEP